MSQKIYDDVYKTLSVKYSKLLIPVINDQFGMKYSENELIIAVANELPKEDGEVIADSVFKIRDKNYHIECQSNPDGTMALRMFEYDVYIALREFKQIDGNHGSITFPKSIVLYLRHKNNTPDYMEVQVNIPDISPVTYRVPIIKVQNYTLDEIFDKKLYIFIPYYLMRYETEMASKEKIQSECSKIITKLDEIFLTVAEEEKIIITEVIRQLKRVTDHQFREEEEFKKKIGGIIMGGEVLKTWEDEKQEMQEEIASKNEEIASKDEEIANKNEEIASMQAEILRLKKQLEK